MVQNRLFFPFGEVGIRLLSESQKIVSRWEQILGPWVAHRNRRTSDGHVTLRLDLRSSLPSVPEQPAIFSDGRDIVDVYQAGKRRFLLHFHAGGLVEVGVTPGAMTIQGTITPGIFAENRLEDVTFTALAAPLRRHSHYLLHAAGSAQGGEVVLFAGASMSGKTTTSLALFLAGWKHLANDVVLLVPSANGIRAFPTPSELTVRTKTLELLPELRRFHDPASGSGPAGVTLRLGESAWAQAGRVTTICFPRVTQATGSRLRNLPTAVGLARLMEESVDRWDREALEGHLDLLSALCRQCRHYELELGSDLEGLPDLLGAQVRGV